MSQKLIKYVEGGDDYVGPLEEIDKGLPEQRWRNNLKFYKKILCALRNIRKSIDLLSVKSTPCCTLYDPTPNFEVTVGDIVEIPFRTARVYHGNFTVLGGVVTPKLEGWYSVYAYCYDDYPNGVHDYRFHLLGKGSIGIVDHHINAAPLIKFSGRQSIYCNGTTDTISAALSHNAVADLNFNHLVGYHHKSYLNINYIGDVNSGNIEAE